MKAYLIIIMAIAILLSMNTLVLAQGLDTDTPDLPPDGEYMTAEDVHATYSGADLLVILELLIHKPIVDPVVRTVIGPDELETFNSTLTGLATVDPDGLGPLGPISGIPVQLTGPVSTLVTDKIGNTTGTFDTEIVSMSLSGNVAGTQIYIRESPSNASDGVTDITDLGGGLYHIDSFFDVFTELSVDGGSSWIASDTSTRMTLEPAVLPGDVNGDGYVGGLDLTAVITNWGVNPATRSQGDLSGDGTVSGPDYTEVITYWGTGTPPEPPSSIPEPATLGLLLLGGLVMLRRRTF